MLSTTDIDVSGRKDKISGTLCKTFPTLNFVESENSYTHTSSYLWTKIRHGLRSKLEMVCVLHRPTYQSRSNDAINRVRPSVSTLPVTNSTRRSAIADCTARRGWKVKRASFVLVWSVPLGPNFTGTGSSSAKTLIPFDVVNVVTVPRK